MLRSNELKKNLFSYVVGGIKSPIFLSNNTFKEQNKKISIDYINLENVYKKQDDFTTDKILKYIDKNKDYRFWHVWHWMGDGRILSGSSDIIPCIIKYLFGVFCIIHARRVFIN